MFHWTSLRDKKWFRDLKTQRFVGFALQRAGGSYKSQDRGNLTERYTWLFLSSDGTGLMWDTSKDLGERHSEALISKLHHEEKGRLGGSIPWNAFHSRGINFLSKGELWSSNYISTEAKKKKKKFHTQTGFPWLKIPLRNHQVLSNSLCWLFFWSLFLFDSKVTDKSLGIAFFIVIYLLSAYIELRLIMTFSKQKLFLFFLSPQLPQPPSFLACGIYTQWNFTQLIRKGKVWTQHSIFIQLHAHPKGEELSQNPLYQREELCSSSSTYPLHPCLSRFPCI